MPKKVLVIGGVAGGASVAARVRRLDESAEIIVFERGPHPSFSNCSLPYFLSREVESSEQLLLMDSKVFKNSYNIDVRVMNEVIKILPEEKSILVKNLETGEEYKESYDELALSPGASAIMPKSIEGIDRENVFPVKTVVEVRALDDYILKNKVEDVVVVGGGFIGLEVMENLKKAGKKVTLVEASDQVMAPLDQDMVQILNKEIHDKGVELILNDGVSKITEDKVVLSSGREIPAGAVVMSIGVSPETKLAKEAGIEIGKLGGIKVDHNYRTNIENIYAVGDVIETHNFITGQKTKLALAGPGQMQARVAANAMYGKYSRNKGVIGASVLEVFDLNVASTGLNEKACQANNIDYRYSYVISPDKVDLMPNSNYMFFKLIFQYPSGKILGAQAVGKGNVDKRLDVVSTLIQMNGNLEDLANLELGYAPGFSTAKDVVNHAALVGLNILNEEFKQVPVTMARELVENNAFIVDVREEEDFKQGHLLNAVNIPLSQIRDRMDEIPKDRPVYIHCKTSKKSYNALRALQGKGYRNIYNIQGSFLGICVYEYFTDIKTGRDKIVSQYNFN